MNIIPLTRGMIAIIDDEDFKEINQWKWQYLAARGPTSTGYAMRSIRIGKKKAALLMHRFILKLPVGKNPETDHINGNGLDNRKSNLRIATRLQNARNVTIKYTNKSGYKGITWHKRTSKWAASIRENGRRKHLGLFSDPVSAAKLYDEASRRVYGEFARCNFPG